jgi:uncharacterized protein (DUF433 family)
MKVIAPQIVIDPDVRFGKPIIKGTRITVEEALGFLAGGMTFEEIEKEHNVNKAQMQAVIDYAAAFLKGEQVRSLRAV